MPKKEITSNKELVAYCGLYCGACGFYLKGRCPGCPYMKGSSCKIRICCLEQGYSSCADCREYEDTRECKKYKKIIAKIICFIFRLDRQACIRQIRKLGIQGYADTMAAQKKKVIKKGAF